MDSAIIKNSIAAVGKTFKVTAFKTLVNKFQDEANLLEIRSKAIKVLGAPSEAKSIELAGLVKRLNKALNDAKLDAKRPYLDFNQSIDKIVKPLTTTLAKIEKDEKSKCKKYRNKVLADQRAAEAMQQKAREKEESSGEEKTLSGMSFVPKGPVRKADENVKTYTGSSAGYKTVFKAELDNILQVPSQYLTVDWKAVDQAVKDGARDIPGFIIKEEIDMRLRG